ncbi:hypothetical protein BP6252_01754 [Coleophoma cylindrospora]|uniref:Myb-like domain-containing protein n=1 Tax=Coleophoma cylindrospora TaxID=1849047 RepID=A0A3D8STT7_9HELO|nr:hypothetical protein BP6252_01754 [Coleophoma cylindrospora]
MPKVTRQRHQEQGYHRNTPLRPLPAQQQQRQQQQQQRRRLVTRSSTRQIAAEQPPQQTHIQIEPMPQLSHQYYTTASMQPQTYSYSNGGPVQSLQPHHYQAIQAQSHLQPQSQTPSTHSLRPSSGAWNPQDDQTLMAARAQGMNWAPIQSAYFPSKTPNACRKRHERLMERRSASDWDALKLETLARNYMSMRKEIWSGLAAATGEKWAVVEAKCMGSGLKNLQAAARSGVRRERLSGEFCGDHGGPGNDSGISGLGPECEDEEGDCDDEGEYDNGSDVSQGYHPSGSAGSAESAAAVYASNPYMNTGAYQQQHLHTHQVGRPQYQQRLPSMDMGIEAIINRTS